VHHDVGDLQPSTRLEDRNASRRTASCPGRDDDAIGDDQVRRGVGGGQSLGQFPDFGALSSRVRARCAAFGKAHDCAYAEPFDRILTLA